MPRLALLFRLLLLGSGTWVAAFPARGAEDWERTLSAFTPGALAELRPLRAQYNFGWNGLTAATAELHLSKTADGNFRLETSGATTGLARTLWKFDVKNVSLSEARTLRPLQVHESETTRGKTLETQLTFTPDKVISQRQEHRGGTMKEKTRTFDFPNALSLNSAMLYLRSKSLPDGAVERVVVYPTTAPYLCTLTVLGREHINAPTGAAEAIKVDLQLNKIGKKRELLPHKKFKRATIWLSNDADHLVLRAEAQVFVGNVFAELQSVQFENGKP